MQISSAQHTPTGEIDRPRVLDVALGEPQALIGESLQPEDPRQNQRAFGRPY